MPIDTSGKRNAALLDPWGIVLPTGAIGVGPRGALVGQYSGIPGSSGVPEPSYVLKWWQRIMFVHTCDLWQKTVTPSGSTYTKRWANVPFWLTRNPSASQVERYGRVEMDDLFTRDLGFFHQDQPIDDTWVLVNKTSNHPEYGKSWAAAGDARIFPNGIGEEGHRQVQLVAQPALPDGVIA